jgi:hypothetical protein
LPALMTSSRCPSGDTAKELPWFVRSTPATRVYSRTRDWPGVNPARCDTATPISRSSDVR